jgi:hypothetical protein
MAAKSKPQKSPMSNEHKQALATGREQGRAVRLYLEAVEQHRPKRGRKRTPESIKKRLEIIETQLSGSDPLGRVLLIQERIDLTAELASKEAKVDLTALEEGFVKSAAEYGRRKGITYQAWREAGVEAPTLRKAGITRSNG